VGDTKHGTLLELRCYGAGQRIFFVFRRNATPEILVGGFDHKSGGAAQSKAIQDATQRVDSYKNGNA
jgi:putative component of toxin-antitoxin plasmid stabilization module